ncbi:MAG: hypothetical protein AB1422_14455 [bacterium]
MTKGIHRRQKPIWKSVRKPIAPPTKPHSTKKGKKGYDRKKWKYEDTSDISEDIPPLLATKILRHKV